MSLKKARDIVGGAGRIARQLAPFQYTISPMLDSTQMQTLRDAVYRAAGTAQVREAVADFYRQVRADVDIRRPVCNASGRCCRFEEFDHRLFVTTIELAAFVYELEMRSWPAENESARAKWTGGGCPFQVAGLCGVHPIRPFGCRIFFCDPGSGPWQQEQYERRHSQLKAMHQALGVPYFYVEWRQGLAAMGITPPSLSRT
jgi:Fe-S-cluster containining protein